MPDGQLIEFDHVTKRFGAVAAVSDFSARVNPGVVTGFLGPNGAGKTTTLRMLVGLERPTIGTTKIGGKRFSELREPARVIGAMLENPGFRARRTVERHLTAAAKANSIPLSRVGELISFVGLGDDVDTRIAALSLGMRQRLSAATALLGDPGVLVLDEPANGLDPEGIRWMRTLIRGLADEGRTVLVSSHVLSEVEQTADEILVIARGELKFAGTMEDLADPSTGPVVVDAADRRALSQALSTAGLEFEILRSGLTVRGSDAASIGAVTAGAGVALTTLQQRGPTLEDVFLDLVNDRFVRPEVRAADAAPEAVATVTAVDAEESTADSDAPVASLFGSVGASALDEGSPATSADEPVGDEVPSDAEDAEPETSDRAPFDITASFADPAAESADTAEAADTTSEPAQEEDRQLPGIAGLAAVASLFNTPTSTSETEGESDTRELADADQSPAVVADEIGADTTDSADDDLDATRAIDIVQDGDADEEAEATASDVISDVPLTESAPEADENLDEADPTEEFFDAFAGDPASEDDDAPDASSGDEPEEHDADNSDSDRSEPTADRH
ncbi:ATP-binding cassette domain-containing protein [Microbacterium sp.]|uniref:ATP-binding cassette domain-containing protein n=1 Tax=Microbacterium sp. TaxID=51671 RepID=UPI0027376A10|nr:ATP-binding cassette domain-containing protein [Microbacterium sp.]MDP3950598.1 ATP-binding cassette domain-containing protein [Microbacterium sp.]